MIETVNPTKPVKKSKSRDTQEREMVRNKVQKMKTLKVKGNKGNLKASFDELMEF